MIVRRSLRSAYGPRPATICALLSSARRTAHFAQSLCLDRSPTSSHRLDAERTTQDSINRVAAWINGTKLAKQNL
jgi:hypothetical protein